MLARLSRALIIVSVPFLLIGAWGHRWFGLTVRGDFPVGVTAAAVFLLSLLLSWAGRERRTAHR